MEDNKLHRIAMIPGDGIGIDVTAEATKVLATLISSRKLPIEPVPFDWGADRYLREGVSLPKGAFEMFRREFQAIFIGALGGPLGTCEVGDWICTRL